MIDYNDSTIITLGSKKLDLVEEHNIYLDEIIPDKVIQNKNVYHITFLDSVYFLKGFDIVTENKRVKRVYLFGFHPNRDNNGLYCLPDTKKNIFLNEEYFNMLLSNIKTYYFDSCYFKPPKTLIKYTKVKSIYIQLNQGDKDES